MEEVSPGEDANDGGGFMIGKKKFVVDNDKLKQAEYLMKRFNAQNDSCDDEDPSSYLKLNNRRF